MARVVLITGSTSGIGLATARWFCARGDDVVLNSRTSVEAGEQLTREIERSYYVQGDISSPDDRARLMNEVRERSGGLDVLVNNAGTTKVIAHHDLAAANVDVWREIFEVNVFATFQMCVDAMDDLRLRRGAIVNVSSLAGLRPTGSSIPYAASKAALNHATELLARVVGPEVRVNAVAPGLVDTPWTADWDAVRERVRSLAPLGRSATADDVAEVIGALAGAAYVTGQVVAVDGGLSLAT